MNFVAFLLVLLAAVWLSSAHLLRKRTGYAYYKTFDLRKKTNYVVYWGSTANEGKLSDYCSDNIYDVIILAFVNAFDGNGVPQLSLDGCNGQDCSALGAQVKYCQNRGKTIMLSVGGAIGSYVLTSDALARKVAINLWQMFLNGRGKTRPFGQGVEFDGMDFDIEQGPPKADVYWVIVINLIRRLTSRDYSKYYYLSGAPQCPFPDQWFGPGPNTAVTNAALDFICVQFYNNGCGIQAYFGIQILGGGTFNYNQWSAAASNRTRKLKILMGIPASASAGTGYQSAENVTKIVNSIRKDANFAGVMMWNAGDAKRNNDYGRQIRNLAL